MAETQPTREAAACQPEAGCGCAWLRRGLGAHLGLEQAAVHDCGLAGRQGARLVKHDRPHPAQAARSAVWEALDWLPAAC